MSTVTSSRLCTRSTRRRAAAARPSRLRSSGTPSSRPRPRPATPSCSTRMLATGRATRRTWAPSAAPTSALRSSSTLHQTRSLSATWPPSALPTFVDCNEGVYDFQKLHEVTQVVVRNLNKIIDVNYYPVPEAQKQQLPPPPHWPSVSRVSPMPSWRCACPSTLLRPSN